MKLKIIIAFTLACFLIACNQSVSNKTDDEKKSTKTTSENNKTTTIDSSIIETDNSTLIVKDEISFASYDIKTILKRLFDSQKINSNNEVLWKPNYYERMNFVVSDDGYCHTKVDTLITYDTNKKLIIFETSKEGYECHACAPTISIAILIKDENGIWKLDFFEKKFIQYGSWGKTDSYGVAKLGSNFYCLKLRSKVDGNQGYFSGWEVYYSIKNYYSGCINCAEPIKEIFSYIYYNSVSGGSEYYADVPDDNATMKIIPTKGENSYYNIQLNSNKGDKLFSTENYKYSDEKGVYVLVK